MHATISQSGMVKALVPLSLPGFLAVLAHPIGAQESASAGKICDVSPDKKFAMRIRYEAETNKQLIEGEKAAVELNKPDDLKVDVKGDVRDGYIRPLRWTKPGVLVLEQLSIFRGGEIDDAKFQFTASFDEKSGKFRVISRKNFIPT
jgi:hypothetical protein